MKKHLLRTLFLLLFTFVYGIVSAQCTIDSTVTAAGIYPDTLPVATAGTPYSQDITFVMLTDTLGLTISNYQLASITGLPIGLSWQCNNPGNGCNYNPATSIYGCVNISGTPLIPGNYTMNVTVVADVQLVGQQNITFQRPLIVLPGIVSNPGFSMQNAVGCNSLTVQFTNNNPGQAAYAWDFGNGIQSTLENPPPQIYSTPGTYVVTQTCTPNISPDYFLTELTVAAIPNNYGGFADDPDIYFLLLDSAGNQVYDSHPSISNTFPPVTFTLPNIPLDSGNYTVVVKDEDGGLFGADDDLGQIQFNRQNNPTGTGTGTVSGASGQLIVNYSIFKTPINTLTATDTVIVYETPAIPVINTSGPLLFCEGNTVTLQINDSVNHIQWFSDSLLLTNDTLNTYTPSVSGNYSVTITTNYGCATTSAIASVQIIPLPPKPNFFINGNTFTTALSGYNFQWYLNGVAIAGATQTSYTATTSGVYTLCATDSNGCSRCSDDLIFTATGISELSDNTFNIYPNPGNGQFTVQFNGASAKTIFIQDLSGRIIEKITDINQTEYHHSTLLNSGTYLVYYLSTTKSKPIKLIVY